MFFPTFVSSLKHVYIVSVPLVRTECEYCSHINIYYTYDGASHTSIKQYICDSIQTLTYALFSIAWKEVCAEMLVSPVPLPSQIFHFSSMNFARAESLIEKSPLQGETRIWCAIYQTRVRASVVCDTHYTCATSRIYFAWMSHKFIYIHIIPRNAQIPFRNNCQLG